MNPVPLETVYPFLLGFLRALGLILIMPVLSSAPIPVLVRVALAAMLGTLGMNEIGAAGAAPEHWFGLILATAHELIAGLLLGWAARFFVYALEFAGQVISTEIGLILGSNVDPLTHGTSSPAGGLLSWLGTMIFLLSGAYRECLLAFIHSFGILPPGAAFSAGVGELVIARSAQIFSLAVQIAAPVMMVNFFVNFVFALLSRVAPSLDAYSASVPVRIMAGITMLGLSLGLAAQLIGAQMSRLPEQMLLFLR
jgi:flagellar biosynthetic protein FliR